MSDEAVSLELLQRMVQRVLDGQATLREDNRAMRRRLARIEQTLLALQRSDVDRTEAEASAQEQIDALSVRVERLERGAP